jgi:hypothetical protein
MILPDCRRLRLNRRQAGILVLKGIFLNLSSIKHPVTGIDSHQTNVMFAT